MSYLDHVPITVRAADVLLPQVMELIKIWKGGREHVVVVDLGATRLSVSHTARVRKRKSTVCMAKP